MEYKISKCISTNANGFLIGSFFFWSKLSVRAQTISSSCPSVKVVLQCYRPHSRINFITYSEETFVKIIYAFLHTGWQKLEENSIAKIDTDCSDMEHTFW